MAYAAAGVRAMAATTAMGAGGCAMTIDNAAMLLVYDDGDGECWAGVGGAYASASASRVDGVRCQVRMRGVE